MLQLLIGASHLFYVTTTSISLLTLYMTAVLLPASSPKECLPPLLPTDLRFPNRLTEQNRPLTASLRLRLATRLPISPLAFFFFFLNCNCNPIAVLLGKSSASFYYFIIYPFINYVLISAPGIFGFPFSAMTSLLPP